MPPCVSAAKISAFMNDLAVSFINNTDLTSNICQMRRRIAHECAYEEYERVTFSITTVEKQLSRLIVFDCNGLKIKS